MSGNGYHQRACRKAEPRIRVHQQAMGTNFQKGYKCCGHKRPCRIPGLSMVRDQINPITHLPSDTHFSTLSHKFLHVAQRLPLLRKIPPNKLTPHREREKTMGPWVHFLTTSPPGREFTSVSQVNMTLVTAQQFSENLLELEPGKYTVNRYFLLHQIVFPCSPQLSFHSKFFKITHKGEKNVGRHAC